MWAWPMPRIRGLVPRLPIISQRYKVATHLGVDVMYRWETGDPTTPPRAALLRSGAPLFCVPDGTPVLAAADGEVLYAKPWKNGMRTRVRTAAGLDFCDFHMEKLFVAKGQLVKQGEPLGICGGDPTDLPAKTVHDHHEHRRKSRPGEFVDGFGCIPYDPELDLATAIVLEAP